MRLRLLSAYSVVMLYHEVGLAGSSRLAVETGALDSCWPRCGLFLVMEIVLEFKDCVLTFNVIKMISAQHSSNNGKNWQKLSYQKNPLSMVIF